jgi:hypothetical protein
VTPESNSRFPNLAVLPNHTCLYRLLLVQRGASFTSGLMCNQYRMHDC